MSSVASSSRSVIKTRSPNCSWGSVLSGEDGASVSGAGSEESVPVLDIMALIGSSRETPTASGRRVWHHGKRRILSPGPRPGPPAMTRSPVLRRQHMKYQPPGQKGAEPERDRDDKNAPRSTQVRVSFSGLTPLTDAANPDRATVAALARRPAVWPPLASSWALGPKCAGLHREESSFCPRACSRLWGRW